MAGKVIIVFVFISLCDQNRLEQDGPSLESSSYLNMTLRYLGPLDPGTMDPWDIGAFEPLDFGTLGL